MSKLSVSNWNDRFALIDALKPSDEQVCSTFGVNQAELDTARGLRQIGTFTASTNFDTSRYSTIFSGAAQPTSTSSKRAPRTTTTTHTRAVAGESDKPESATRKSAITKVPQKRGRKGDKITKALMAVSTTPVPVNDFIKTYGVSLAVLRQAKRFASKISSFQGVVKVKQDKASKQLMIWRQDQE